MPEHQIRLDLISPELLLRLGKASKEQLREIVHSVCRLVVERTGLENEIIDEVMEILDSGSQNNDSLRVSINNFVEALDEKQWNLQELVEIGQAKKSDYFSAFSRARAANALYYALDQDPLFSAAEVIYEANAALDDLTIVETLARSILDNE